MSFYGKVYNVIGNAFKRFKFTNKGKDSESAPNSFSSEVTVDAETANDFLTVASGNGWLGFKKEDEGECGIYHLAPRSSVSTKAQDLIKDVKNEATYDTLITFGDVITLQSPTFDEAGHINGYTTKKYKLEEVPEVGEVIATVQDVETINNVLGLPLAEGVTLPSEPLLDRVSSTETVNTNQNERIGKLEDIAEQILGVVIDPETGLAVSALEQRIKALENMIGDLHEVDMEIPDDQLSVAAIFGNLRDVASGRSSLADILGNLDEEFGVHKNYATELGTLSKNVALILKHLGL